MWDAILEVIAVRHPHLVKKLAQGKEAANLVIVTELVTAEPGLGLICLSVYLSILFTFDSVHSEVFLFFLLVHACSA